MGGVVQLLRQDALPDEIAEHLHAIETQRIEMTTSPERRRYVADLTRRWYPESIARWRDNTKGV